MRSPTCPPTAGGGRWTPAPRARCSSGSRRLPALTKADLRDHGPEGLLAPGRLIDDGVMRGEIELVQTSGTTSERVTNAWHQPWWDASERASWKLNAHAAAADLGAHREAILTSPRSTGVACEDGELPMAAADPRPVPLPDGADRRRRLDDRPDGPDAAGDRRVLADGARGESFVPRAARPSRAGDGNPAPATRAGRAHLREPVARAARAHPRGVRRADRQLLRLDRGRVRVHGMRARTDAPGERLLPRRLPALRPPVRGPAAGAASRDHAGQPVADPGPLRRRRHGLPRAGRPGPKPPARTAPAAGRAASCWRVSRAGSRGSRSTRGAGR